MYDVETWWEYLSSVVRMLMWRRRIDQKYTVSQKSRPLLFLRQLWQIWIYFLNFFPFTIKLKEIFAEEDGIITTSLEVCCRTTWRKVSVQLCNFTAQLIQFKVMQRHLITVSFTSVLLFCLSTQINDSAHVHVFSCARQSGQWMRRRIQDHVSWKRLTTSTSNRIAFNNIYKESQRRDETINSVLL